MRDESDGVDAGHDQCPGHTGGEPTPHFIEGEVPEGVERLEYEVERLSFLVEDERKLRDQDRAALRAADEALRAGDRGQERRRG